MRRSQYCRDQHVPQDNATQLTPTAPTVAHDKHCCSKHFTSRYKRKRNRHTTRCAQKQWCSVQSRRKGQ
jgi:hypothetical protein